MPNALTDNIPIGDIQFYDNYTPSLPPGQWKIELSHTLVQNNQTINTDQLTCTQEFSVSAPQVTIDPTEIVTVYPPQGSTGAYGQVLPHIVLNEPLLPWERRMQDPANPEPWLALLVFADGELLPGDITSPTQTTTTTVSQFLNLASPVLTPTIVQEPDVANDESCAYIQLPIALFQAITPRLQELRYLAHCRQINTGDKAILGLNENGLFSVVVANRFPAVPANPSDPPTQSVVHLVSVEGFDSYLTANPNFGSYTFVAMLSFASWTFFSQADSEQDFRGLVNNLVSSETNGSTTDPSLLSLSLPAPTGLSSSDPNQAEVLKRVADGFVPLWYHTRTGEDTFAWYRGPLTPLLTTPLVKPADQQGPFMTADSAIIYQDSVGMFDMSLAAAWNIGRAVALSDKSFGNTLLSFRTSTQSLIDQLLYRLQSDSFSQTQISELDTDTTVQDEFLTLLNEQLLFDIGQGPNPSTGPSQTSTPPPDTDPQVALQNFLADPEVQQLILSSVQANLDPISQWLAKLILLYPVPFTYLVPDERMLGPESLRFFYLDNNWLGALLDGAQSIGLESSRQTFLFDLTHDLITDAAFAAASVYRSQLLGTEPPSSETQLNVMSGFVLRSALVSGWPNLAIRPFLNSGEMLKILRLDVLSPTVMLCIFWGVPDYVEISEPQEGLCFGVDDSGDVALRNLIPPATSSDPAVGAQLTAQPFQVRDLTGQSAVYMRDTTSRVLNLDPTSSTALVQQLQSALATALQQPLPTFGPADFAIQFVKAPEAIDFNCLSRTT